MSPREFSLLSRLRPAVLAVAGMLPTGWCPGTDYHSAGPGVGQPDGMCDVWQQIHGAWGLDPNGDEDQDGCSNGAEAIAGTDPRQGGDCFQLDDLAVSGSSVVIRVATETGKRYQLRRNTLPDAGAGGWTDLGPPVTGTGTVISFVAQAGASGSPRFYQVRTQDQDTDGDGVSDWAEGKTGTNPAVAASPTNASGGVANDGDTLRSLLSLTAETVRNGYERQARHEVGSPAVPARIRLTRGFGTMPLNNLALSSQGAAPSATKGAASAADLELAPVSIAAGAASVEVAVTPVKDAIEEVPEHAEIRVGLPGLAGAGPSAMVMISESDPADEANRQLYVAFLGREAGVVSTASGYATALVSGDNDSALVSLVFSNLSSAQNTAYIRIGEPNSSLEVRVLPLGQVSGVNWNIRAAQFATTDQAMLSALASGNVYVTVSSANYPDKEIFGYFNKASGSTTFNPDDPSLNAPELGSANWQNPTGEALEREIWRFLGQSTFGGTQALYDEVLAEVSAAVGGGGSYIDGLANWLDKQMNPALTPTVNFQTLVMAADNEEFMLRGNKPITFGSDPQFANGVGYNVTYDASGVPTFNPTADANRPVNNYPNGGPNRRREWWGMVLQCRDQVRQRMALALSEILVISEADQTVLDRHYGTANYWDMLAGGAFGKYRTLLEQVSHSPMMGVYLSHIANRATYDAGGGLIVSPDENYAREIMQLFSIGLVLRHPDGSLVLDGTGLPVPTYDQEDITELARVMTGWSHGARNAISWVSQWSTATLTWNHQSAQRVGSNVLLNGGSANSQWFGQDAGHLFFPTPWVHPMKLIGRIGTTVYHDFNGYVDPATGSPVAGVSKRLLAGKHGQYDIPMRTGLPAATGYSNDVQWHAAAALDMTEAHNCLAGNPAAGTYGDGSLGNPGHTNTPVNVSRWLIQRLVTSNPSNGYIYRVQKRYRETNGDLGAVLKAILLDYEARSLQLADSSIAHGKVKEPLVAFAAMLRGLRAFSGAPLALLRDTPPPFSASDSPLPGPYPASEFNKFSTQNANPPSLPEGWSTGPFRFRLNDITNNIGQSPQRAPSVFNWFLPDYVKPGPMAEAGLFAPELQISTESSDVAKVNFFYNYTLSAPVGTSSQPGTDSAISDFTLSSNSATGAAFFSVNGQVTSSLTFDSANWNTNQTVTVTAVNNSTLGALANNLLRFNVSGSGTGYDGLAQAPEVVTVLDDERPNEAILVSGTGFNTWVQEGGKTDGAQVRLSAPPPAGVTVTVNVSANGSQVSVSPASLNFTLANWDTNQVVTVTAVNDAVSEAAGTGGATLLFTSSAPAAANFDGLTASHAVGVVDNDDGASSFHVLISNTAGLDVSETGNTSGAGTASYTIVLTKQPSANVTVNITPANANIAVNTTNGGTSFSTGTVTRAFTPTTWGVPQTVVVRGNDDGTAEGSFPANPLHGGMIQHAIATSSGGYVTSQPIQPVGVRVTDNDERIVLTHSNGETRVSEDGAVTDTFTVRLRTAPTANVTVSFGSNTVACEPPFVTFTPGNFSTNQTVTARALDDSERQGLRSAWTEAEAPVAATATGAFGGGMVTGVTVTNGGAGYTSQPRVTISGGNGSGATAYALVSPAGTISGIQVVSGGTGYTAAPTVTIDPPPYGGGVIIATGNSENLADGNYNNYWSYTHSALKVSILDNDLTGLVITETGGGTEVNEGLQTDTYALSLASRPSADVTVRIQPLANTGVPPVAQVATDVASVVFTPANWNTPQVVRVSGVNDATVEGDVNTLIHHSAQSGDRAYNGLQARPLTVMVVDNDSLPLTITHLDGYTAVAEGGAAFSGSVTNGLIHLGDRFNVRLPVAPTANVVVSVVPEAGQLAVTPATLTFTPANGTTDQGVTVTAVDDGVAEATPHTGAIRFELASADARFNNPPNDPLLVPIMDNDSPGLVLAETDGGTSITLPYGGSTRPTEGGTDNFTVMLARAPASNVVVSAGSSSPGDLTVSPATLTFTPGNWNTRQTVTVTAINDQVIEERERVDVTLAVVDGSSDDAYDAVPDRVLPVWVFNNPRRNEGLVIVQTGNSSFVAEGGKSDTLWFYLTARPEAPVPVSIDSNGQLGFDKTAFVFTPENWNVPQAVVVTAVDDLAAEHNHTSNVQFRCNALPGGVLVPGDARWTFVNPASTVNIVDNDAAGVIIEETGGDTRTVEGGATDVYTVRLSRAPTGDVVVTPVSASLSTGQTVSPGSLTFTPGNWFAPQTVTVTAANDNSQEGYTTAILNQANIHVSNITHVIQAASTDEGVHRVVLSGGSTTSGSRTVTCATTAGLLAGMGIEGEGIPAGATITSVDNPTALTLSAAANATASGQALTAFTSGYSRALTGGATTSGSAVVTVASTAYLRAGMGISGTGIPAGATISAVNSATTLTLSAAANATASGQGYVAFVTAQAVSNFITDDDLRVITRHTGLETRIHEDGTVADSYEVVLREAPGTNVTVTVGVPSGQGVAADKATLTFTPTNWATPQVVTVSGVDNGVNDRFRVVDITHTVNGDALFAGATVPSIRAQVVAKDTPQIVMYESGSTTVLTEGGQIDDYYIGLSHAPTADVVVTVATDGQQEVATVPAAGAAAEYRPGLTMTFTPADWAVKRFLIRAVDDGVAEATPHTGWVTHSAASGDARYAGITVAGIPCFITDNDYAAVRVVPSGGSTLLTEGGAADTYNVVLTRAPSADVQIAIQGGGQASAVSPGGTLTFTSANWNVAQTVTVAAVDDAAVEGAHTATITHTATSGDGAYHGVGVPAVAATITDNDGPRLVVTHSGGGTTVTEGNATDTFTIRLSQAPTGAGSVTVTLVPPMYIIPTPPYAKQFGYYTSDLPVSNQNRERVVMDFAEIIQLYRDTFYGHLEGVYGTGGIPSSPADADLQNAHWAASKAMVDRLDLWWCGGSLKGRNPVLIEPNQPPPDPVPQTNARQVIMDCLYYLNGGNNNLSTTRYEPEVVFNPKNPPNTTFANEVRDRARWAAYLMSTVMPAFVSH